MRTEKDVKKGDFFRRQGRIFKVIGVVEGYAVLRLKGCMPFLHSCRRLVQCYDGWEDLQDKPTA